MYDMPIVNTSAGMSKQLMGEEPAANGIGFCLVGMPFAAACFFREQVRVHYNIGGHSLIDGFCSIFCLPCSLCQIYRQLKAKPVMRSKLSSQFSSRLYEFYQVRILACFPVVWSRACTVSS
jgi:Cys-rich protein (TIGR01571 family)